MAPVDDAIMQAAQAYGHVLDFGDLKDAEAAALVGLPTGTVFDLRAGVAFLESANTSELAAALKVPHDPADALGVQDAFFARAMELHKKTPRTNVASAAALPLMQQQQVLPASQTTVAGGQEYDWGHFVGTEYRKGGSHGQTVSDGSTGYTVGDSSADPLDFSSARNWNLEPAPKNGEVVVGRTLVAAVGVLSDGRVVETADGQVEVYGVLGDLLAVYDPQTKTAGDTRGTQNASSAQMAAVIAHQVMHARNPFDAALATDLTRARSGNGSGLAAADSAYIALKNGLFANGADIQLGGQISTQKCPDCGQFMGSAHICPNQEAVGAPAADAVAAPAAMEQPQVNIEVEVDTQPIADAMGGQELTLDSDALAKALQDGLGVGQPAAAQAASGDFSGVEAALTQMAEAITQLAQNDGAGISDERLAELIASTASNMGQPVVMADAAPAAVAAPAPAAVTAPAAKKKRKKIDLDAAKAGRPLVEDLKGKKKGTLTAQERMFKDITLPAPDPFLRAVPEHVGGQLDEPLMQSIPALNTDFQINDSTRDILRAMAATLKAGQAAEEDQQGALRTFGLYGPPGGGKNTILRQLAASLIVEHPDGEKLRGIPYVEATLLPDSSIEELIGATVLVSDGEGGTESRVQLGRLGLAAAMGSVVVINEAVRSPKLMTKLQSMIEDRVIEVDSPEGGVIEIPVHPSTVFGVTWNSGLEGDADRPALAPLSRMMTFPLAPPTNDEQAMRVDAFFAGMSEDVRPTPEETMAGVLFMNDINLMTNGGIGDRKIGLNSDAPTGPGPRELNRFLLLGKTTGDWRLAAKTLAICCDQDATFKDQWSLINERFEAHFGVDGNAVNRAQAGEAPAMN